MCCSDHSQLALDLTIQLLRGVAFMQSLQITHVDLKPDNIMIEDDTGRLVIADMGLATTRFEHASAIAHVGNMYYNSAQSCNGFSQTFDAKAARLCVLEMLSGVPAYLNPTRNIGQYTAWIQTHGSNLNSRAGVLFVNLDVKKRDAGDALNLGHRTINTGQKVVNAAKEVAFRSIRFHDHSNTELRSRMDPPVAVASGYLEETLSTLSWLGNPTVAGILVNLDSESMDLNEACDHHLCQLLDSPGTGFACDPSKLARDPNPHVGHIRGGKRGVHSQQQQLLPSIDPGHVKPQVSSSLGRHDPNPPHPPRGSKQEGSPRTGHHLVAENLSPPRPPPPRSGGDSGGSTRPKLKCHKEYVEQVDRGVDCSFRPKAKMFGGGFEGRYPCTLTVQCGHTREIRSNIMESGTSVVSFGADCTPCQAK